MCGIVQKTGNPWFEANHDLQSFSPIQNHNMIGVLFGYPVFMLQSSAEVAVNRCWFPAEIRLRLCGTVGENYPAYLVPGERSVMISCRQHVRSTCQIHRVVSFVFFWITAYCQHPICWFFFFEWIVGTKISLVVNPVLSWRFPLRSNQTIHKSMLKEITLWLWLTVRHGKIHHAIKNGKPSISMGHGFHGKLLVDFRWTVGRLPPFALPAQNINNVAPPVRMVYITPWSLVIRCYKYIINIHI